MGFLPEVRDTISCGGVPIKKEDSNILVSLLGSPYFGKLSEKLIAALGSFSSSLDQQARLENYGATES